MLLTDGRDETPGAQDSGGETLDSPVPVEAAADAPTPPPGDDGSPTPTPPPPPDFVWYRLDEMSGATAHDSSPHHYDITNLTGVVWGGGATFDGATVCGSTTVGPAFRTAPVTITLWLTAYTRADETVTNYALTPFPPNALSGDAPSLGGFGVGLDVWTDGNPGNGIAFETGVNAASSFYTIGGLAAGVQYFAALVVGPAQADLYVNATLFASTAANTPLAETPAPLHLGCHNDDTGYLTKRFFDGRLRDARIYTRLLGAPEVAQLYANGPV
jgi:concanavalin A-like lectin/glucanase superfamily protein